MHRHFFVGIVIGTLVAFFALVSCSADARMVYGPMKDGTALGADMESLRLIPMGSTGKMAMRMNVQLGTLPVTAFLPLAFCERTTGIIVIRRGHDAGSNAEMITHPFSELHAPSEWTVADELVMTMCYVARQRGWIAGA